MRKWLSSDDDAWDLPPAQWRGRSAVDGSGPLLGALTLPKAASSEENSEERVIAKGNEASIEPVLPGDTSALKHVSTGFTHQPESVQDRAGWILAIAVDDDQDVALRGLEAAPHVPTHGAFLRAGDVAHVGPRPREFRSDRRCSVRIAGMKVRNEDDLEPNASIAQLCV